jgi:diguanylate cyclase (GGDEF)-like protein
VESLVTDDLTKVYNYRFMKAALRREVERASRYGQVFSILMIDVDRLKEFNEKHGHLEGSDLLRRLSGILSGTSRAIDLVSKYGGDEFCSSSPDQHRGRGGDGLAHLRRGGGVAVSHSSPATSP